MEIRFTKFFEKTEKKAKQLTLSETGIRLDSNGRPVDYGTIPSSVGTFLHDSEIKFGAPDVLAWIKSPGEEKHRLLHKHGSQVRLRVKPKQDGWLASIEIESQADDYNLIKRSLEDNGWGGKTFSWSLNSKNRLAFSTFGGCLSALTLAPKSFLCYHLMNENPSESKGILCLLFTLIQQYQVTWSQDRVVFHGYQNGKELPVSFGTINVSNSCCRTL